MNHRKPVALGAIVVALLLFAAPALAHVSMEADNAAPEALTTYRMRVPSESQDADTVKIEVQLPAGLGTPRPRAVRGWKVAIDEGVLTYSGGRIGPGQSKTFVFRAQNPAKAGDLVFPVLQTYSDGEEAAWIGDPGSDNPAPVVTIAGEPDPPRGGAGGGQGGSDEPPGDPTAPVPTEPPDGPTEAVGQPTAAPAAPAGDGAEGTSTLTNVALVLGLIGIVTAVGARLFARRSGGVPRT